MEKWILRGLLVAIGGLLTGAVIGSLDDIKRYVKISRM